MANFIKRVLPLSVFIWISKTSQGWNFTNFEYLTADKLSRNSNIDKLLKHCKEFPCKL